MWVERPKDLGKKVDNSLHHTSPVRGLYLPTDTNLDRVNKS